MKILDYITQASIAGKAVCESDVNSFARDINAEVFALNADSVIIICDTKKMQFKKVAKIEEQYAMCLVGRWDNAIIKTSNSKEELIEDYSKLVISGLVDVRRSSTNLKEQVKDAMKK